MTDVGVSSGDFLKSDAGIGETALRESDIRDIRIGREAPNYRTRG